MGVPEAYTLILADDIMENGLHQPIVMYQGQILDGRNRYQACLLSGLEPEFAQYEGDDPLNYVLSLNLHRRHLTTSQRASLGVEIANMTSGRRTDLEPSLKLAEVSQSEAAERLDVSPAYIREAKKIQRESPDHFERVKSGELTIQQVKRELKPQIVVLPEEEESTTDLVVEFDGKPIRTLNDLLKAKTPDQKMVDRFFELDIAVIKVSKIVNELSSHPINKIMSVIYDCDEITRTLKYQANSLLESAKFYQELIGEEREEP